MGFVALAATGFAPSNGIRMLGALVSGSFERPEINYAALRGLPRSFGREAGEHALKSEVPLKSNDGWEIATFAGGCFWGTELHYQRLPGVIAT